MLVLKTWNLLSVLIKLHKKEFKSSNQLFSSSSQQSALTVFRLIKDSPLVAVSPLSNCPPSLADTWTRPRYPARLTTQHWRHLSRRFNSHIILSTISDQWSMRPLQTRAPVSVSSVCSSQCWDETRDWECPGHHSPRVRSSSSRASEHLSLITGLVMVIVWHWSLWPWLMLANIIVAPPTLLESQSAMVWCWRWEEFQWWSRHWPVLMQWRVSRWVLFCSLFHSNQWSYRIVKESNSNIWPNQTFVSDQS